MRILDESGLGEAILKNTFKYLEVFMKKFLCFTVFLLFLIYNILSSYAALYIASFSAATIPVANIYPDKANAIIDGIHVLIIFLPIKFPRKTEVMIPKAVV